jgi:hypothetical protein
MPRGQCMQLQFSTKAKNNNSLIKQEKTGWSGQTCEIPLCDNGGCGPGTCVKPNQCDCSGTGWTGSRCDQAICNTPCQHSGTCVGSLPYVYPIFTPEKALKLALAIRPNGQVNIVKFVSCVTLSYH